MSKTNIPKDGYYSATVYHDTGGPIRTPVQVDLGKVFNLCGAELLPDACSEFEEMPLRDAVTAWPDAHAGLIESLQNDVRELNVVLQDWRQQLDVLRRDAWVGAACLHLLAEHGVPIGSPELLAAKDRIEAEIDTLRTANAEIGRAHV